VLRPAFISRHQFATLSHACERLSAILDGIECLVLKNPQLLNRIQMLPAERMLAALSCGYSRSSIAARMHAVFQNGSVCMRGFETCNPAGIGYADRLADLFLRVPVMKDFQRGGYRVQKLGSTRSLVKTVHQAWKEFGGELRPNIAIVEIRNSAGTQSNDTNLLAGILVKSGASVRVVAPDHLEYSNGKLRAGNFEIHVVLRRLLTRELLVRFNLSHPLLLAYQQRSVCVVNGFRSEVARRRALFELLTDESVTATLHAEDQKVIKSYVPWTRVVTARKTRYRNQDIDLLPFVLRHREQFALHPNDDSDEHQAFVGAELTPSAWDRALRLALRTPYVVQEYPRPDLQTFPVFHYGELKMKQASMSLHPHMLDGKLQGASATLDLSNGVLSQGPALAPVLAIDGN